MEYIKKEKTIDHPLEDAFDIEPGSTIIEYTETVPQPLADSNMYDDKDNDIEDRLEEIYATAMAQAVSVSDELERVEGKYKARISEVTATMLNVALSAVRERREMKQHKDKLVVGRNGSTNTTTNTTNNNLVVADRNELLKMITGKKD